MKKIRTFAAVLSAAAMLTGSSVSALAYEGDLKPVDLTMLVISPNCNESELAKISEKVSEITEEKFNATVNLITVTPDDYANKLNMMLASGDPLDIFQPWMMYNQYLSQEYVMPLEDYEEYIAGAEEALGDRMAVTKSGGHIYGLPYANLGGTGGDAYIFRKDIVDELEINFDEVKTFDDFTDMLRKMKEAYPDMTPIMGGGVAQTLQFRVDMSTNLYPDSLGNSSSMVAVYDPFNSSTVECSLTSEAFKTAAQYAWDWAQEGLIGYDEVATTDELVKAGKAIGYYYSAGPVAEDEWESSTGYEGIAWMPQSDKAVIYTNNTWTWCVTDYCEEPERALMVLNEFYVNPELANLLEWGIEGEHYQVVDAEKGIVDFLDGEDMGSVGYFNYIKDSTVPNCFLTYVGANEKQDKWELYQEFHENNTQASPYLGFVFDQSDVQTEVAACSNIRAKYYTGLLSGQLDPSTELENMEVELKNAGIERIVEEAQTQLDNWIEENR